MQDYYYYCYYDFFLFLCGVFLLFIEKDFCCSTKRTSCFLLVGQSSSSSPTGSVSQHVMSISAGIRHNEVNTLVETHVVSKANSPQYG